MAYDYDNTLRTPNATLMNFSDRLFLLRICAPLGLSQSTGLLTSWKILTHFLFGWLGVHILLAEAARSSVQTK